MGRTDYDGALKVLRDNRKEAVDRLVMAEMVTKELLDAVIERHLAVEAVVAVRDGK